MRPVDAHVSRTGLLTSANRHPQIVVARQDALLDLRPPCLHHLSVVGSSGALDAVAVLLFRPIGNRVAPHQRLRPLSVVLCGVRMDMPIAGTYLRQVRGSARIAESHRSNGSKDRGSQNCERRYCSHLQSVAQIPDACCGLVVLNLDDFVLAFGNGAALTICELNA